MKTENIAAVLSSFFLDDSSGIPARLRKRLEGGERPYRPLHAEDLQTNNR